MALLVLAGDGRLAEGVEVLRIANTSHAGGEEVGIQRHDPQGLGEVVNGVQRFAKGQLGPLTNVVPIDRFVLNPFGSGVLLEERFDRRRQAGRADRFGQQTDVLGLCQLRLQLADGGFPGDFLTGLAIDHLTRAVRIIQAQQAGLHEHVGRAEAAGMAWIAFDLDRPAFAAFHQDARGHALLGVTGGVEERQTGGHLFRLLHVRIDFAAGRRAGRTSDAGQGHGGARQGQEGAPADRIVPSGGVLREFPVEHLGEFGRVGEVLEAEPQVVAAAGLIRIFRIGSQGHRSLITLG